jgi:hypothetical protein
MMNGVFALDERQRFLETQHMRAVWLSPTSRQQVHIQAAIVLAQAGVGHVLKAVT